MLNKNSVGLIQISGFARAGKDTVASILMRETGCKQWAYAAKLKALAQSLTVYACEHPDGSFQQCVPEDAFHEIAFWNGQDSTKRHPCVQLGKNARDILYPNIWVDALTQDPRFAQDIVNCGAVVSDCRYIKEHEAGKELAKKLCVPYSLWWIENPDVVPQGEEAERTAPLLVLADVIIYNGGGVTLSELEHSVSQMSDSIWLQRAALIQH